MMSGKCERTKMRQMYQNVCKRAFVLKVIINNHKYCDMH